MKPFALSAFLVLQFFVFAYSDSLSQVKSALLVIDIQNDFTNPDGKSSVRAKDAENCIATINSLSTHFIDANQKVITVSNVWENPFRGMLFGFAARKGSWGAQLNNSLVFSADTAFEKSRPSCFSNKQLVSYLQRAAIKHVYVVGVKANQCVQATIKHGHSIGFDIIAVSDGIAANSDNAKQKAISKYHTFDVRIVKSSEVTLQN